jgi:cytochrome c biogenesis protein CcdA
VTDLLTGMLQAADSGAAVVYPLAFGAGAVTSAGPCVAPRYLTLAAIVQGAARPWSVIATYVGGLVAATIALSLALDTLTLLHGVASVIDALLALALAAAGLATLARGGTCTENHARRPRVLGVGGVALLGACGALVVSPCCTPVMLAIAGLAVTGSRAGGTTLLLTAYALGHAMPLLLAGAAGARLVRPFAAFAGTHAPATVSGTLMLALASYYGVIA